MKVTVKKSRLFFVLSVTLATFVFLKNAWVCEDAYIVFRSVEQLFAGNGPIWNPHERVQVFTSPLWFWLLSFVRLFSSDVYLNAIIVSLALWLITVFIIRKILNSDGVLLVTILLFSASTAFFDYTSSGLENILAYLVIAIYLLNYVRLFALRRDNNILEEEAEQRIIKTIFVVFGLIICVRHDLALLLLPATVYVLVKKSQVFSKQGWAFIISVSLLPIVAWTLFSLIYYGFPFPNTAYAKLSTGIDQIDLLKQGTEYFVSSLKFDTITLVVIATSLLMTFISSTERHLKYIGCGIILNLLYILYIGGDFMQGRFLSYAFMVSVILLLIREIKLALKIKLASVFAVILYILLYHHTPLNSPLNYANYEIDMGVADERGFYCQGLSLYVYLATRNQSHVFPRHHWALEGFELRKHPYTISIKGNIGFYGYWSGVNAIIIDPLALSDPLLARLPAESHSRVGHYFRNVPYGYIESIKYNQEIILDRQLNRFYKRLKIITQSDKLFTVERLKTIILFNIGAYKPLIVDEAVAEVIPLQYTDRDYENGIARAEANKGSLPGPGILLLSWDKKRPIPFQKGDILVFAKTGAATIVHIATMQNPTTISMFVSVNKPLDPKGDGFPNQVTIAAQ